MLNCDIKDFEFQSFCYIPFHVIPLRKVQIPLIHHSFALNSTIIVFLQGFGIEQPLTVDMPLNKETSQYYIKYIQCITEGMVV